MNKNPATVSTSVVTVIDLELHLSVAAGDTIVSAAVPLPQNQLPFSLFSFHLCPKCFP